MEAAKETKFGAKVARDEDDARTSNTRIAQIKRAIPHLTMKAHQQHMTCVVVTAHMTSVSVTALCNQPASDLIDDQSRYLL